MNDAVINSVKEYYSDKVKQHGNTSAGVDWNSKESQYLRFEQLSKIIQKPVFSILDYGCGYGEYINYLNKCNYNFTYHGFDVSSAMIDNARKQFVQNEDIKFDTELPGSKFDYVIASGIFNVNASLATDEEWLSYILEIIQIMNSVSLKGFSFNALTKYSDKEYMKDYLYYADPLQLFDFCKRNISKNVALLHDYNLYEFTILVRKDG